MYAKRDWLVFKLNSRRGVNVAHDGIVIVTHNGKPVIEENEDGFYEDITHARTSLICRKELGGYGKGKGMV